MVNSIVGDLVITGGVVLTLIAGCVGYILRSLWDRYVGKKQATEIDLWKIRVSDVEKRLREFYWPIYLRLQRDNVVWEKILQRGSEDEEAKSVAQVIENEVILPNHLKIISLIESGMHFVRGDKELEAALLAYMRHVDVYRSIRAAGVKGKDPTYFDEPYPGDFFEVIENRVFRLQKLYDEILAERTSG